MNIKSNDPLLDNIKRDITHNYKCHTIILYGSRARNNATKISDYDIIAIREKGDFERDCQILEDIYLDIFIYSEDDIKNPDKSFIRIKDGIVLCQKDHLGDELLNKVKLIFQTGPSPTPNWEMHEINAWIMKMLERTKQGDIEANFRRHWLLHELLECYFKLRNAWYLGPKESFKWLEHNDALTYIAFDKALKPNADFNSLEDLIARVRL